MIASAHAVQVKLESEKILERAFQENQVFIHVTDYVYFSITTSSIWGQSHSSIYTTHTVHIMLWEKGDAVLFKSEIWAIQYANPCCLLRYWATLLDTSAQSSSLVSLALRLHPMIHTCTGLWVGSGGPLSRGWGGQSPGHTTQETLPEPPLLCLLPSWWTTLVILVVYWTYFCDNLRIKCDGGTRFATAFRPFFYNFLLSTTRYFTVTALTVAACSVFKESMCKKRGRKARQSKQVNVHPGPLHRRSVA